MIVAEFKQIRRQKCFAHLRDYLNGLNVIFYHDMHAYSQYVLIPWGWPSTDNQCKQYPEYDKLLARAEEVNLNNLVKLL